MSAPGRIFKHRATGRILHNRAVSANGYRSHFGHIHKVSRTDECEIIGRTRKHRYLYPLTASMKTVVEKLRKPNAPQAKRTSRLDSRRGRCESDRGAPVSNCPLHGTVGRHVATCVTRRHHLSGVILYGSRSSTILALGRVVEYAPSFQETVRVQPSVSATASASWYVSA
jgi:hypothetical protein